MDVLQNQASSLIEVDLVDLAHPYPDVYLVGHNVRYGYAVQREYHRGNESRYYTCSPSRVRAIVNRFNRLAARKRAAIAAARLAPQQEQQ